MNLNENRIAMSKSIIAFLSQPPISVYQLHENPQCVSLRHSNSFRSTPTCPDVTAQTGIGKAAMA